jgi:hypothetical protein
MIIAYQSAQPLATFDRAARPAEVSGERPYHLQEGKRYAKANCVPILDAFYIQLLPPEHNLG